MAIGITQVLLQPIIPVGSLKRRSTTLVRWVGVFPMAVAMVSGQKLWALHHLILTLMTTVEKV